MSGERATHARPPRLLKVACLLTLTSLALICWAILHPVPLAVIAAMSIGQGIGAIGAALFAWVVLRDLRSSLRSGLAKRAAPTDAEGEADQGAGAGSETPK